MMRITLVLSLLRLMNHENMDETGQTSEISSRTQQRLYVYKSIFLAEARKFIVQFEMDSVTRPFPSTEVL